jgi:hypothetical protein
MYKGGGGGTGGSLLPPDEPMPTAGEFSLSGV